ncbi:MAG: amidohydrolase family protein [Anaerolineales bacterium]|nr:amidohydrolase family protein [Anaerolineales bacterium]
MAKLLKLPGLIDVHTHLRTPGGEHKEDFASGTAAALAGGITLILAMPNTNPPLAALPVLEAARQQAQRSIYCDVGLFAGASPTQIDELPRLAGQAVALKIYLNETFGLLRVEDLPTLLACFRHWPPANCCKKERRCSNTARGVMPSAKGVMWPRSLIKCMASPAATTRGSYTLRPALQAERQHRTARQGKRARVQRRPAM